MNLVVLGLNHKTAPVEVREKLSIPENKIGENIRLLQAKSPEALESVILSTCNRVEFYTRVTDVKQGVEALKSFLCEYHEIPREELDKSIYLYTLDEAVEHLFRVASSLDSMVLGEPQILGQVKSAYKAARELSATGTVLNQLFERSFSVAKRVRNETGIAENAVSISYAAVELAQKIFGDLSGKTVMLIGAGEMIELATKHLVAKGVKTVLVSNRTYERAVELARQFSGEAIRFDDLHDELRRCDIVISSTGAPHFVVRRELAEAVIAERGQRPIFFIDIAVPRDIEPSVNDIDNCYVYDIDDLQQVVSANMAEREKEAERAAQIVRAEVGQFLSWLDELELTPTIIALREKMEVTRKRELAKTMKRLAHLSDADKEAVERLSTSLMAKAVHDPIVAVKQAAPTDEGTHLLQALRRLYGLDEE
ncbi:MAG: glutamyl-tRNA reductase [Nitrospinae bacterium]|nr:glutamyl-tRNA reductase [Nitrospinota bacterium]